MAVVVLGISASFISVQGQQDYDIPQWVKNNAGWWADDSTDDESQPKKKIPKWAEGNDLNSSN